MILDVHFNDLLYQFSVSKYKRAWSLLIHLYIIGISLAFRYLKICLVLISKANITKQIMQYYTLSLPELELELHHGLLVLMTNLKTGPQFVIFGIDTVELTFYLLISLLRRCLFSTLAINQLVRTYLILLMYV